MSEIESGLKEYIEHFGKEIVKNLDELNFYYKHEFIFFSEFRTNIYENLNCLLLGLYQASICMTNHLLERMLKHALIDFEMKGCYIGNPAFNEKLKEGYRLYDNKSLNDNTSAACKKGIITEEEGGKLKELKNKYRNPYSHASVKKIISEKPELVKGWIGKFPVPEEDSKPLRNITVPSEIFSEYYQADIAKKEAFPYFKIVFGTMVAIDQRYQKYKE